MEGGINKRIDKWTDYQTNKLMFYFKIYQIVCLNCTHYLCMALCNLNNSPNLSHFENRV